MDITHAGSVDPQIYPLLLSSPSLPFFSSPFLPTAPTPYQGDMPFACFHSCARVARAWQRSFYVSVPLPRVTGRVTGRR